MIMVIMTMIMVIKSMLQIKIMKNKMLQITFNPHHWMVEAGQPLSSPSASELGKACLIIRLLMGFGAFWQLFKGCLLT